MRQHHEEPNKVCATQDRESDASATNLGVVLVAMRALSIPALQQQYQMLFGRPAPTSHRTFLLRRVAWELQARRVGGLSDQATDRLAELADAINPLAEAAIAAGRRRVAKRQGESKPFGDRLPHDVATGRPRHRSIRRPKPGTVIQRVYRGRQIVVWVREDDYEYDGRRYRSLSAIAKAVTGAHWNGWLFFGLTRQRRAV